MYAVLLLRLMTLCVDGMDSESLRHDDVVTAAKSANAHEFIEGFAEKYATEVGDRGLQLSGGQKQRIAIARAMLRKPKLLFLDEATSSLDAESEAQVQEAIDKLIRLGKCTIVLVAHRLSTVMNGALLYLVQITDPFFQLTKSLLLMVAALPKKALMMNWWPEAAFMQNWSIGKSRDERTC